MRLSGRVATAIVVVSVLLTVGCGTGSTPPGSGGLSAAVNASEPFTGARMLHIGRAHVAVTCEGREHTGIPAVVFLTGMSAPQAVFRSLRARVARFTRACTYDRPGDGRSSRPRRTETLRSSDRLLHAVLGGAQVTGRIVLVGHSVGGMLVASYAHAHPVQVSGVVLLDATPPSMIERTLATIPARTLGSAGWARAEMDHLASGANSEHFRYHGERFGHLGNRPMVVIQHAPGLFASITGYGPALDRFWSDGQDAWARLSTTSRLITAYGSGHDIYRDRPGLTYRAIARVVRSSSH